MPSTVAADASTAARPGGSSDASLHAALTRGALVVTPNKRLAREIVSRYDRECAQRSPAGTWIAARVLPWGPFVHELMQGAQDHGLAVPPLTLESTQAAQLWKRIVRADLRDKPLVDADAAAALAMEAWALVHAYGAGLDGWRGLSGSEDVTAFVGWAAAYASELRRLDATDAARAADLLVSIAPELPGVAALDIVVAGFVALAPQQQRLLEALQAAGARIELLAPNRSQAPEGARLVPCTTPEAELASALAWARDRALADPEATIAIVVPDLAARRAAVRAACEDLLCAPLQWPGRESEPRPYDLSLGPSLADVPLVASALSLIEVAHRPIDRASASALIRSPFLPEAASMWMRRAALERTWIENGVRLVDARRLVDDLARIDADLSGRIARALRELPRPTRLAPRAWVERWRSWLAQVGWCESLTLASEAFQAMSAWNELLGAFARLAAVAPSLSQDDALATLRALADDRVFQAASSQARIRVLGLLEATGLAFDALWLTGMDADAWPRSPDPHPLLPLAWQRERGVPRATADSELEFARDVIGQLLAASREVVVSFAAVADEHHRVASPLIAHLAVREIGNAPPGTDATLFAGREPLECVADSMAPPLLPGSRLPGGAGLFEKVFDCRFRAVASHRLSAQPWPAATLGLSPLHRGTLVHATLAAFWSETRTHEALMAMDDRALLAALARAYAAARNEIPAARWATLPPAIAALEETCTLDVVREWIERFERSRPAFRVRSIEQRLPVELGGYALDVRLDRVDGSAAGAIVIDYKTGPASGPVRWFEPLPRGIQVALYARAHEQAAAGESVRAMAYAQLRAGEVRAAGLSADASVWPGLMLPEDVRGAGLSDWQAAQARLNQTLDEAAAAFARGDAAVAPRNAAICSTCGLQALCRIASVRELVDEPGGGVDG